MNGLERPKPNEGYALQNGISTNSISVSFENVKTYEWMRKYAPGVTLVKKMGGFDVGGGRVKRHKKRQGRRLGCPPKGVSRPNLACHYQYNRFVGICQANKKRGTAMFLFFIDSVCIQMA